MEPDASVGYGEFTGRNGVKRNAYAAFPKPKVRKGRGCRMSNVDHDAKIRLGYKDINSFVRLDGSEVLYGADWRKRKEELWERSGGRCESEEPWTVWPWGAPALERCTSEADDPHHVRARREQRDDRLSNLQALCRYHHRKLDKRVVRLGRIGVTV